MCTKPRFLIIIFFSAPLPQGQASANLFHCGINKREEDAKRTKIISGLVQVHSVGQKGLPNCHINLQLVAPYE